MDNQHNFPPNINPQLYNFTAFIVGATLVDDFTAPEQNSIGNWLMLVAQYIITHAAQQNLIESRNRYNQNVQTSNQIECLMAAIQKIYEELEKIKNEN